MELSIFLAKLLGVYMLIIAAEILLRRAEFEGIVKDVASSKGLLAFSGSFSLLLGLAIAIAHPVHTFNWAGLITLIGYLLILRGIIRVAFPTHIQGKLCSMFHQGYWAIFAVSAVVGAYLTYSGFAA